MNAAKIFGGLAGALSLTAVHESVRQFVPEAPRVDLVGVRAIRELLYKTNIPIPALDTQRQLALGGDLVSNAAYYSLAGHSYTRGALLGLAAGLGGVFLPGPMGLGEAPTSRSTATQLLTVGYYTLGGLVATAVTRALSR
jgi:hypothetical protein